MGNLWLVEEDEILRSIYGMCKINKVVEAIPRHPLSSIHKRAQKLKLKGNHHLAQKRYTVDGSYFAERSLRNCYWAGFIAADGCIGRDGVSVKIALAVKDKEQLRRFCSDVGYDGPIKHCMAKQKNGTRTPAVRVDIWGVPGWVRDLQRHFNITPTKSLTLKPPRGLTWDQSLAFIIGYIDGDGSIRWNKDAQRKDGTWRYRFHFEIVGTRRVLTWIRIILSKIDYRVWKSSIYTINRHPAIRYSNSLAKRLCRHLLQIECGPRMERKWNNVL